MTTLLWILALALQEGPELKARQWALEMRQECAAALGSVEGVGSVGVGGAGVDYRLLIVVRDALTQHEVRDLIGGDTYGGVRIVWSIAAPPRPPSPEPPPQPPIEKPRMPPPDLRSEYPNAWGALTTDCDIIRNYLKMKPVTHPAGNGKSWQPDNPDRKFRGPITLEQALEESVNVVTVKLQQQIGLQRTIDMARRLGITSPLHEDLTMALGSSDLSLLELTTAYAALANQGFWVPPTPIRYVTDGQDGPLEEHRPEGRQAISRELAYLITHMLIGVVERGTAEGAKALGRPIAGKTGTTNGYADAWFIGYTPDLVTGVWVGYDRPRSLGVDETGARAALPIWVDYMGKVLADVPRQHFPVPESVVFVSVDLDLAGTCTRPVKMAFLGGTEPSTSCEGMLDVLRQFFRLELSPFSASEWARTRGDTSSSHSP